MFDIVILGGGAAGQVCAITAKRKNKSLKIAIIDAMPKMGKKILATGNGRCNLSNEKASSHIYHNNEFAQNIISKFDVQKTKEFFNSVGLFTITDEEGRIYPMSNTALSVVDCLRLEIEKEDITVITDERISSVKKYEDFFVIDGRYRTKKLVIACGGKASPSQGSDGSGFKLLESLGHSIITPLPGLVQLTSDNKIIRTFKGLRVKSTLELFAENEKISDIQGEVLFTEYGLSGIACMDAQRILCRYIKTNKCSVSIDLVPYFTKEEILQKIKEIVKNNPSLKSENLLSGFLPKKIGQGVIKCAYIKDNTPVNEISKDNLDKISSLCKGFRVYLSGYKGFENAQITCGGAKVNEFDKNTLQSHITENLYCIGECLDVDGGCGGFNLQWAFSSGGVVGEGI